MAKEPQIELPHPRMNPSLFGHAEAQARFLQEFEQGNVHHAYLMTGPKGIGKATLAYRFARYILSQGAQAAKVEEAPSMSLFGEEPTPATAPTSNPMEMDAESSLFKRIAASSHTDLLTLSPAFDAKKGQEKDIITVDDARKVPDFLSLTPAEGEWRVVIVDAVDQLNENAANALLKILEEPPARAMLFLICHQPASILTTIRSRCRTLSLQAPNRAEFGEILTRYAPHIGSDEYAALYNLAYGSPGLAMTLAQENALKWYEGWLTAMQPEAGVEARLRFAESAAAQKSPSAWDCLIHCWQLAMQRLTLHPLEAKPAILPSETRLLASLAAHYPPPARQRWIEEGRQLLWQTETFNLDKKQTIRLLADFNQMDRLAA